MEIEKKDLMPLSFLKRKDIPLPFRECGILWKKGRRRGEPFVGSLLAGALCLRLYE